LLRQPVLARNAFARFNVAHALSAVAPFRFPPRFSTHRIRAVVLAGRLFQRADLDALLDAAISDSSRGHGKTSQRAEQITGVKRGGE
jgi:hypothetical protein